MKINWKDLIVKTLLFVFIVGAFGYCAHRCEKLVCQDLDLCRKPFG